MCCVCVLGEVPYSLYSHCIAVERCNLTEVVQHWENAEGTSHKPKPAKHTDCWHQNAVTMCHIKENKKLHKNRIYRKYSILSNENIRYLSDIYQGYNIGNTHQANHAWSVLGSLSTASCIPSCTVFSYCLSTFVSALL